MVVGSGIWWCMAYRYTICIAARIAVPSVLKDDGVTQGTGQAPRAKLVLVWVAMCQAQVVADPSVPMMIPSGCWNDSVMMASVVLSCRYVNMIFSHGEMGKWSINVSWDVGGLDIDVGVVWG